MTLILNPALFYTLHNPSRCDLRLYLREKGVRPSPPGAFEEILFRLGQRHEKNHLATFPDYIDLRGAPFEKILEAIRKGSPVIYQGELRVQTMIGGQPVDVVGIPDFMIKEEAGYIIRDCKMARNATEERHPEITLQLQVYGWLFERATGQRPVRIEAFLGDGRIESFDYAGEDAVLSYLNSLSEIITLPDEPYSPVGWSKCTGCGYYERCWPRACRDQDVAIVYQIDQNLVMSLREAGVYTIKGLIDSFDIPRLSSFKRPWGKKEQKVGEKAKEILLQAKALLDNKGIILKRPELPLSRSYIMFDLEGLPPYLDELDKIYLWGMQVFGERPGAYQYALAGTGPERDKAGWEEFLRIAGRILDEYGNIPFVHWHHYEKTKIKMYLERYGDKDSVAERVLSNLVDLLPLCRDAVVLPLPSYSLKIIERYIGFRRSQEEYGGEWSIAKYIEAVETEDEEKRLSLMGEILKYNEEDLQATWVVFNWLKGIEVTPCDPSP